MGTDQPGLRWRDRAALRLQAAWTRRGPLAVALLPLAWVYRTLLVLDRARQRRRRGNAPRSGVPVVVVGNLVAGGAGKTPTVRAVVDALRDQGHRPAVASRGHGRHGSNVREVLPDTPVSDAGDEPLLLRLRAQVPVAVGRDRSAVVAHLLAAHPETTVVVCDDGLQHHRLARDLQLVVFDERGLGNGWLLPAGPLREPPPARGTWADHPPTRVVYNAPRPTTMLPGTCVRAALAGAVPLRGWWQGEPADPAALTRWAADGSLAFAAAGTARPQRFFGMLTQAGLRTVECPLPDHHAYAELPWPPRQGLVLVTEKDAIKLSPDRPGTEGVWVVPLDFQLDPQLLADLANLLPAPAQPPSPSRPHGQPIA